MHWTLNGCRHTVLGSQFYCKCVCMCMHMYSKQGVKTDELLIISEQTHTILHLELHEI
jgi:hypothetical protein